MLSIENKGQTDLVTVNATNCSSLLTFTLMVTLTMTWTCNAKSVLIIKY